MKKLSIFCSALVALAMVSCDENPGLGIPQTNPQEAIMAVDGVEVAYGTALEGENPAIDLSDEFENKMIPVINVVRTDNMPENATLELKMQLATTEDFTNATTLDVKNGCVSAEEWNTYFRDKLGKSPAAKDNYVRFEAYIAESGQLSRLGTPDTYLAFKKVNVTPVPMDFTIEDEYYLVGTVNGWDLANAIPMSHSNQNVYDDPVFSITVEISEADASGEGWWWKIAPKSKKDAASWDLVGPADNGDPALEGTLIDNGQAGCIKEAGSFLLTINMMDMTYKFQKLLPLYTPGNSNEWSQTDSQLIMYDAEKGVYCGFAHLNGEFKFSSEPNWDGTNYGNGGDGVLSTDGGAGNLDTGEGDGLYYLEADLVNLTWSFVKIDSFGMIGDFNNWGGDVNMTHSDDFLTWTGTLTVGADQTWKFRANGGWDINLGGDFNNLTFGGGNLNSGAGTFKVTLDLSSVPYKASYTPAAAVRRK